MLTQRDRQLLRRTTSKAHGFAFILFVLAIASMLAMGGFNFVLASRFAAIDGTPFGAVLASWWHSDIELAAQYSGAYLRAVERIGTGSLLIGGALVCGVFFYAWWRLRRVHLNVVETLREHGEWPES